MAVFRVVRAIVVMVDDVVKGDVLDLWLCRQFTG